jgi:NADP-dependent 3-hydroxy acid dehydrogenase YdfG
MRRRSVTIAGKRWQIRYSPQLVNYGETHCGTDATGKPVRVIKLRPSQSDEELLDTAIHEALHAAFWGVLDEPAVERTAEDIARVVLALFRVERLP